MSTSHIGETEPMSNYLEMREDRDRIYRDYVEQVNEVHRLRKEIEQLKRENEALCFRLQRLAAGMSN